MSEGGNSDGNNGPRIGLYYGVVIDQDHLDIKLDPIDIATLIEKITKVSPFDIGATWKLDYDHSQSYRTIIIYNNKYSKITKCPGYIGGWNACGNTKCVPLDISSIAENISTCIEKFLQPNLSDESYALLGVGYSIAYFVA